MPKNLNIWPEEVRRDSGWAITSATVEPPSGERQTLWYKIPEEHATSLHPTCDPFVVGLVYLLMQAGHDGHVHGQVSPSLLRNLEEFQAAWVAWVPGLSNVTIRADREEEAGFVGHRGDAVLGFSGGVDSCFTAFRNVRGETQRNPCRLTAGIMVHGFDIPLADVGGFQKAKAQSKHLLSSLGLELIPMATNYRELIDWNGSYGAAVASSLMQLAGRFGVGMIAQGLTYRDVGVMIEGSNPLTDPFLSSRGFAVVPDGGAFKRSAKVAAMKGWVEFLRDLRVCWEGPRRGENCCECEKCVRTILTFRALGIGLPPCFPRDVPDDRVATVRMTSSAYSEFKYGELAGIAEAHGVTGTWLKIIERRLAQIRRLERSAMLRRANRLFPYGARLLTRLIGLR